MFNLQSMFSTEHSFPHVENKQLPRSLSHVPLFHAHQQWTVVGGQFKVQCSMFNRSIEHVSPLVEA